MRDVSGFVVCFSGRSLASGAPTALPSDLFELKFPSPPDDLLQDAEDWSES